MYVFWFRIFQTFKEMFLGVSPSNSEELSRMRNLVITHLFYCIGALSKILFEEKASGTKAY